MTKTDTAGDQNLRTLIDADLQDTLDEELEMELDDRRLEQLEGIRPAREMHEPMDRSHYFTTLADCRFAALFRIPESIFQ